MSVTNATIPKSVRIIEPSEIEKISTDIINIGMQTGCLNKQIEILSSKDLSKSWQKDHSLEKPCKLINEAFSELKKTAQAFSILKKSTDTLKNFTTPYFQLQLKKVFESLTISQQKIFSKFDEVYNFTSDKVNEKFEETINKLNLFRNKPTNDNLTDAKGSLVQLKERMNVVIGLSERCSAKFSPDQQECIKKIQSSVYILTSLIDPKTEDLEVPALMNKFSIYIHNKSLQDTQAEHELKQMFNQFLETRPNELTTKIDNYIRQFTSVAKADENWVKIHRYDDWALFKRALSEAILDFCQSDVLKSFETSPFRKDENLTQLLQTLSEIAFFPEVGEDPVAWAKSEIVSLVHLSPIAIEKIRENNPLPPDEDEIMNKNNNNNF
jgi:hypothetical protein